MNRSFEIYKNYNDILWFYNDKLKNISVNGEKKIIELLGSWVFCTEKWYSVWNSDYSEYILFIPRNLIQKLIEIKNYFNKHSERLVSEKVDLFECEFEGQYSISDNNYIMQIYKKWVTWFD